MKKLDHFIDGQFVPPAADAYFPNLDPATGKELSQVAQGDAHDIDRAVQAAKRAFHGEWSAWTLNQRLDALERVAHGIRARFDEFVEAEMRDTGKPRSFASTIDIPRGAANFEFFANFARTLQDAAFHTPTSDGQGALQYTIRHPLGVVGVISPWNLPLLLLTWKVAPALAAGNCVVVKPSEETPTTATLLAKVFKDAGIPDGVYNVVHGYGPDAAGEALTRHPDVVAITFTGESATGAQIMKACAPHIKNISFELGGKNPAIIFADADFNAALAGTARSTFSNTGQVCLCSERVYVERPIFERFAQALADLAQKINVGDPFDETTQLGPLISQGHRQKVLSAFQTAKDEGATFLAGGSIPELPKKFAQGAFVQPTVLTVLSEDSPVNRQEIFGPICHIRPFDTEEEAIALANDTSYGLCAAIWTQNLSRAHRMAHQIEAGMVWINSWFLRDLRTPIGGVKLSGIGREGGQYSMDFYSETKTVCVKL